MAYGLDVVDLIYTDPNYVDVGTLEDYEVDLDINGRKDFELRIDSYIIEPRSIWYVEGTEFGGIIDGFQTDPQSYQIRYTGRSWRGILDSKVIFSTGPSDVITVEGKLTTVLNTMLFEYGLSDMFVCDPYETNFEIASYDLISGTSVYDAMIELGDDIGVGFELFFNNRDKKVHIVPNVPFDYTDYLAYCRDNSISFTISKNTAVTNHVVCSGVDENGQHRTIHLFTNEGGEIQPYTKDGVQRPTKDDDYILDDSKQVLKGIDEITDYVEAQISVQNNYQLVTSKAKPADWDNSYDTKYFEKRITPSYGEEIIRTVPNRPRPSIVSVDQYLYDSDYELRQGQTIVKDAHAVLCNPQSVAIIDFDDSFKGYTLSINGANMMVPYSGQIITPYSGTLEELVIKYKTNVLSSDYDYVASIKKRSKEIKLSDSYRNQKISIYPVLDKNTSYEPVQTVIKETYNIVNTQPAGWNSTYSYYYTRSWSQADQKWEYSAATSTSKTDMNNLTRITSKDAPLDWKTNYNQYYYKFQTGTSVILQQYQGQSNDRYTKLKNKPDDWDTNFSSYYEWKNQEYTSISSSNNKAPAFKPNVYYKHDTYETPPKYNSANCYLPATKVIAPEFKTEKYFDKVTSAVRPTYKSSVYYELLEDHYLSLVSSGLNTLRSLSAEDSQTITVSEFNLNIGDTVGGYDEETGVTVSQPVTNKVVKIKRGVLTTDYEIGGEV